MSDRKERSLDRLADTLALRAQELRSRGLVSETATLLSLDYASQRAKAPYLFDMADGILHRKHCAAALNGSTSTLYAVWELREGDQKLACPVCSPHSGESALIDTGSASDTFLGIISSVDQFRSIFRERGRESRISHAQVAKKQKLASRLKLLGADMRRLLGKVR
jgi:hypothetical protein